MASGIELVVFDLGRVLVRICKDWRHACQMAGIVPPPEERVAAGWARVHDAVCRVEVGHITGDEFCAEVAAAFGVLPGEISAALAAFTHGPYPGAVELLDELQARGVATACLSNTNEPHWRLMRDPSSHTYFPFDRLTHAFASHLLRLRKPDDAVYAHVERATGVRGDRIVFFDDVEENVEGARRRGWHAYHIDPAPDDPLPQVRSHLETQGVLYTRD
ncbi:MAG TPA: HAD family phosphatase [Tepidisphaeraceae bacterium]|nr:HAD family phosphatase [Tepidisphaeraceae bacterium]